MLNKKMNRNSIVYWYFFSEKAGALKQLVYCECLQNKKKIVKIAQFRG